LFPIDDGGFIPTAVSWQVFPFLKPMKAAPVKFNPHPFAYHQELELDIHALTNLGMGVGRYGDWIVMVPFVIPGERVKVRVFRNHKNYSEADLVEVLSPSGDRVEALCPYYGTCGGCQYQHLSYGAQLDWKRQHVVDCLKRIGGIEAEVAVPISSAQLFAYRSKLTPHHQPPRGGELGPFGFLAVGSRTRIVDIERCVIGMDGMQEAWLQARTRLQAQAAEGRLKKGSTVLLRQTLEGVTDDHAQVVRERVGERLFEFKAGDFFQNNPFVLPLMVNWVVEQAAATGLPHLIDAYCGSGLFSVCASSRFQHCIGVEISESSVRWAQSNARLNGCDNCAYHVGEAQEIFAHIPFEGSTAVMVIDPPRRGCDEVFLDQVGRFAPARIVYVSCDPATQARDLVALMGQGYRIETIQPVDLFPQTRHIENMVVLQRA
jgi:23S rRNA (uracil1939-C5)-methyltransferase/tRNA (uracil-5-)-methyltransferase